MFFHTLILCYRSPVYNASLEPFEAKIGKLFTTVNKIPRELEFGCNTYTSESTEKTDSQGISKECLWLEY